MSWETKAQIPVLDIHLFSGNRIIAFSSLAAFLNYSSTYAIVFFLSLYFQYIKGFSPQDAGLILVAQPVVQAIFSPLAGRLSDRIDPRIVASIGMIVTDLGLFFLIFLNESTVLIS